MTHEWKEYRLSDLCELIGGGTPKTTIPEYWGGDIPWLSVSDFNNGNKFVFKAEKKITEKGLTESSTKILTKGQIIISARGTVGVIAMLGRDMAFNQSNYGIDAKKDLTSNEFLYYLLKDNLENFVSVSYGAVFDTITKDTFDYIIVSIPSISEQKKIAEVLSSLDYKIDLLQRQNKTLEQLAETLFRQWFVEEADDSWEAGKIDDIVSIKGGTTPSTANSDFWNGNIHWTSPRDLSNSNSIFLFDTERKISEKGLAQIGSGLLPIGTVLLSSRAPIGYLTITEIPVAINQGYIAIICDKIVSNYFIFLWLKSNINSVVNAANGSVFLEISKSTFRELELQIPPKEKLMYFDEKIESVFMKVKMNNIEIKRLTELRDFLLPKLIRGEVRVTIDDEA